MKLLLLLATGALAWPLTAGIDRAQDEKAVERAVQDYLEALYEVKPELIERGVHTDLTKFGFYMPEDGAEYKGGGMSYDQLHKLAGRWNKDGKQASADSPRVVEVLDVLDQTASAKLTAEWGIDYMHLAKYEGEWKILQVLWQSHPPSND